MSGDTKAQIVTQVIELTARVRSLELELRLWRAAFREARLPPPEPPIRVPPHGAMHRPGRRSRR